MSAEASTKKKLKALVIEDSEIDALLLIEQLKAGGYELKRNGGQRRGIERRAGGPIVGHHFLRPQHAEFQLDRRAENGARGIQMFHF